ncbi:hypothetical protein DFJ74DRAFT_707685 [Hyaloraphidium curvatum]|nr:hypothetical protein DFJ74DRAFT_707685 [Hyaloraphidium curvatum]
MLSPGDLLLPFTRNASTVPPLHPALPLSPRELAALRDADALAKWWPLASACYASVGVWFNRQLCGLVDSRLARMGWGTLPRPATRFLAAYAGVVGAAAGMAGHLQVARKGLLRSLPAGSGLRRRMLAAQFGGMPYPPPAADWPGDLLVEGAGEGEGSAWDRIRRGNAGQEGGGGTGPR